MSQKKDNLRVNKLNYSRFFTSDEDSSDEALPPDAKFPLRARKRIFDGAPDRPKARKSLIERAFSKAREDVAVDDAASSTSTGRKRIFQMPERPRARKSIIDRCFSSNLVSSTPMNSAKKTFNKSVPLSPIAAEHPEQQGRIDKTPISDLLLPGVSALSTDKQPENVQVETVKPSSRSIQVQTDIPFADVPNEVEGDYLKRTDGGKDKTVRKRSVELVRSKRIEESSDEDDPLTAMMLTKVDEVIEKHHLGEDSSSSDSRISWLNGLLSRRGRRDSGSSDASSSTVQNEKDTQNQRKVPEIPNNIKSREYDRNERNLQNMGTHTADWNRKTSAKVLFPLGKEVPEKSTRDSTKNKTCRRGTSNKSVANKQISSIVDSQFEEFDSHHTYYRESVAKKGSRVNSLCEQLLQNRLSAREILNDWNSSSEFENIERSQTSTETRCKNTVPETPANIGAENTATNKKNNTSRKKGSKETSRERMVDRRPRSKSHRRKGQENEEAFAETSTDKAVERTSKNRKSRKTGIEEISLERCTYRAAGNTSNNERRRHQKNEEEFIDMSIDNAVENISKNKRNNDSGKRGNRKMEISANKTVENPSKFNKNRENEFLDVSIDNAVEDTSKNEKRTNSRRRENEKSYFERWIDKAVENSSKYCNSRQQENEEAFLDNSTDNVVKNKRNNSRKAIEDTSENNKSRQRENEDAYLDVSIDNATADTSKNKKHSNIRKRENEHTSFERRIDKAVENTSKYNKSKQQESEEAFLDKSTDNLRNKKNNNSRKTVENTSENNKSKQRESEEAYLDVSIDNALENTLKNKQRSNSRKRENEKTSFERQIDKAVENTRKYNKSRQQENERAFLDISTDNLRNKKNNNSRKTAENTLENNKSGERENGNEFPGVSIDNAVENTSKNKKRGNSRKRENEKTSSKRSVDKAVENTSENNKSRQRENEEAFQDTSIDRAVKNISMKDENREQDNDGAFLGVGNAAEDTSKNKKRSYKKIRDNDKTPSERPTNKAVENTSKYNKSRQQENEEAFVDTPTDNVVKNISRNKGRTKGKVKPVPETSTDRAVKDIAMKDKSGGRENEEAFLDISIENKKNDERREEVSADRSIEVRKSPRLNKNKSQCESREKKLEVDSSSISKNSLDNRAMDKIVEKRVQEPKNNKIVIQISNIKGNYNSYSDGKNKQVFVSNKTLDGTPDIPLQEFLYPGVSATTKDNSPKKSTTCTRKVVTPTSVDKENLPNRVIKKSKRQTKLVPKITVESNSTIENGGVRRSTRQRRPKPLGYIPAVLLTQNPRLLNANTSKQSSIIAGANWLDMSESMKTNSRRTQSRTRKTSATKKNEKKGKSITSEGADFAESMPSTSYATNLLPSVAEEPKSPAINSKAPKSPAANSEGPKSPAANSEGPKSPATNGEEPPSKEQSSAQQQTKEERLSIASLHSDYKKRPYLYYPKNNKLRRIDWHVPELDWKPIGDGESMRMCVGCKSAQAGFQNGYLEILPGKSKPKEMTTNYTVSFFVVEGECFFQVHDCFDLAKKYSSIQVPLGALYSIINASTTERVLLGYAKIKGQDS